LEFIIFCLSVFTVKILIEWEKIVLKIYTGFGDKGKTRLYGGQIVDKDDLRVQAYGTVDELNSVIGLLITYIQNDKLSNDLQGVQYNLFELSAELASPADNRSTDLPSPFTDTTITELENKIDRIDDALEPLKNFILPGGSRGAALSHLARTVCRRAERAMITLHHVEKINNQILIYMNRLSDYLFVLARLLNKENNHPDISWIKRN
jgi:cob(I)alamin adenosyltransferase